MKLAPVVCKTCSSVKLSLSLGWFSDATPPAARTPSMLACIVGTFSSRSTNSTDLDIPNPLTWIGPLPLGICFPTSSPLTMTISSVSYSVSTLWSVIASQS